MEMYANEIGCLLYLMRATYLESVEPPNASNGVSGCPVFNDSFFPVYCEFHAKHCSASSPFLLRWGQTACLECELKTFVWSATNEWGRKVLKADKTGSRCWGNKFYPVQHPNVKARSLLAWLRLWWFYVLIIYFMIKRRPSSVSWIWSPCWFCRAFP